MPTRSAQHARVRSQRSEEAQGRGRAGRRALVVMVLTLCGLSMLSLAFSSYR